jgi:hypothetical protein
MRICLITAFPPSGRQLNEYAFHLARDLQSNPLIDLRILADELDEYQFVTDRTGKPLKLSKQPELPGFNVVVRQNSVQLQNQQLARFPHRAHLL